MERMTFQSIMHSVDVPFPPGSVRTALSSCMYECHYLLNSLYVKSGSVHVNSLARHTVPSLAKL